MRGRFSLLWGLGYVCVLSLGISAGLLALSGCGGGGGDSAADGDTTNGDKQNDTADGTGDAAPGPRVDANGRKWVGHDFPYDVWYQDPALIARTQTPASDGNNTQPVAGGESTRPDPPPSTGGDATDWNAIIPAELVDAEMTRVTNRLRAKLQTVATYNSSSLELPPYITSLTFMAAIAIEHPGEIRWKENATAIRDLAATMPTDKLMRGPKAFKMMQEPFESISEILNGSPPADPPKAGEGDPIADSIEMESLMYRMKAAEGWFTINASTADLLTKNEDDIRREAAVVAAIASVIGREGYGFGDDDEFKGFASSLLQGARKISSAVETKDLDGVQLGFSEMRAACQQCHNAKN